MTMPKRSATMGYIARSMDVSTGTNSQFKSVRLPDGKMVKVVDRALFDRAVSAAVQKKKKYA